MAALLSAAAIWLSTWQGELSRDSTGARRSVEVIGAAAIVAMVALGWRRRPGSSRAWAAGTVRVTGGWRDQPNARLISLLVWCLLIAGVIGWDLFSFLVQSPSFPTLSTLIGHVSRHPIGRGLLFGSWLVVGVYAVAGCRSAPRR